MLCFSHYYAPFQKLGQNNEKGYKTAILTNCCTEKDINDKTMNYSLTKNKFFQILIYFWIKKHTQKLENDKFFKLICALNAPYS